MTSPPEKPITYFARTTFRNRNISFDIKRADRLAHMYAIGKTGTGKTTLLETLIRQDIANGLALLDPHGDLAMVSQPRIAVRVAAIGAEDF